MGRGGLHEAPGQRHALTEDSPLSTRTCCRSMCCVCLQTRARARTYTHTHTHCVVSSNYVCFEHRVPAALSVFSQRNEETKRSSFECGGATPVLEGTLMVFGTTHAIPSSLYKKRADCESMIRPMRTTVGTKKGNPQKLLLSVSEGHHNTRTGQTTRP